MNPLTYPDILTLILSGNHRLSEIANFRLVCKAWAETVKKARVQLITLPGGILTEKIFNILPNLISVDHAEIHLTALSHIPSSFQRGKCHIPHASPTDLFTFIKGQIDSGKPNLSLTIKSNLGTVGFHDQWLVCLAPIDVRGLVDIAYDRQKQKVQLLTNSSYVQAIDYSHVSQIYLSSTQDLLEDIKAVQYLRPLLIDQTLSCLLVEQEDIFREIAIENLAKEARIKCVKRGKLLVLTR